ncbi:MULTISPECIES: hypothetical protein [Pseudomonas]|jgi:hypothetical protein|uniref:hypothetical protein n=1 Tax=Pseudomonas TaxID=286 RepID=UPI0004890F4B|nr:MULTISPECIES: hypothetical protein [Pseudomonas]PRA49484.1 hypothetical protein CQZ98_20065 [Pseudomonas sp. MYb115]QXN47546.1 hypothetical protein KW062_14570 [Pseudomonas fluorescens]WSO21847.1 hypothetical protein VUJ50_14660 [Pseudomonas fluorescens]
MAAQGKHSSLRFKAIASSGVFLMAGVAVMLLADYFELTTGWLAGFADWLVLKTSVPNWLLLLIIAVLTSLLCIAIFQARSTYALNGEPHGTARRARKATAPQPLQLTDNQTLLLEALAYHAHCRKIANLHSVCKLVSLSTQEVELGLKQLQAKRLLNQNVTRGTFGSTTFELTAAGKDYAAERLKLT